MKKSTAYKIKDLVISVATTVVKVAIAAYIIIHAFEFAKTAYPKEPPVEVGETLNPLVIIA